jgi:hypothetical protein
MPIRGLRATVHWSNLMIHESDLQKAHSGGKTPLLFPAATGGHLHGVLIV